ncbi:MAG: hypothetical protein CFH19_00336 [Alphaproteobacteria bacterium MarineAlpha5_Bin9]|nr:MAG: hypothetical protein CFH19_00336 [Alphaproteobacteria bacterium MarineAlpha5_Bin9]|tara:strand:- start:12098 stop:12592 length:495 start_codon:yes stop_codon:yes gene_type:complete
MKKLDIKILNDFMNIKNEKVFLDKINQTIRREIGFILFTLTVKHPKKKIVKRIYSSNNKVYPTGGMKKIPKNYFFKVTFEMQKSFIGNNIKEIRKYHSDHKKITDLGAEAILNQVIIFDKQTIGTLNLLNVSNYFNKKHLVLTNMISKFLTPIFLNHQIKMLKK